MLDGRTPRVTRGVPVAAALSCCGLVGALALALRCGKISERSVPSAPSPSKPAVVWQEPVMVGSGRAHAGPWRMNESVFLYVDDGSVAIGAGGAIGVVWVDNEHKDVLFRSYARNGAPAGRSTNVSNSPSVFSWLPRIVLGPADEVFVLWQEIVFSGGSHGGEIFFARSSDGGGRFGPPLNLSNSAAGDGKGQLTPEHWHNGSLDLLRAPDGSLNVAWTAYEGALFFSRSTDGGGSWSPPERVAEDEPLPARAPSLGAAPDGTLYLAWAVGRDPRAGIRLARSRDGGRSFDVPWIMQDAAGYSDAPKIAIDPRGGLHLAYTLSLGGFFGPFQVRYARRHAGGTFEAPRVLAGLSDAGPGASFPGLSLSGAGHVYVAWEHHPVLNEPAQGLGFMVSENGGDSFTAPLVVPGTAEAALGVNGSRQGALGQKLAVDAAGFVALVDSRFREGEQSSVRLLLTR